jgi:hypothetical protein
LGTGMVDHDMRRNRKDLPPKSKNEPPKFYEKPEYFKMFLEKSTDEMTDEEWEWTQIERSLDLTKRIEYLNPDQVITLREKMFQRHGYD